jgi:hypothetical protein
MSMATKISRFFIIFTALLLDKIAGYTEIHSALYRTLVLYIGHVARRLCVFVAPFLVLGLKEGTKFGPSWPPL